MPPLRRVTGARHILAASIRAALAELSASQPLNRQARALHAAMYPPPGQPATVLIFAPTVRQAEELHYNLVQLYKRMGNVAPVEPRASDRFISPT